MSLRRFVPWIVSLAVLAWEIHSLIALAPSPAAAAGLSFYPETTVTQSTSPVSIRTCQVAPVYQKDGTKTEQAWIAFTNTGTQVATSIRFRFDFDDAYGSSVGSSYGDVTGMFSPGVLISKLKDAQWAWVMPGNPGQVACSVTAVRFADGTVWRDPSPQPTFLWPPVAGAAT